MLKPENNQYPSKYANYVIINSIHILYCYQLYGLFFALKYACVYTI